MKIIKEASVYLTSSPFTDHEGLGHFLEDNGCREWETDTGRDAQEIPEIAGRLCYLSFTKPRPGGNAAYLKHILEVGHGSVLEHANFGFIFTGVSRSLTHELVRHRAGMAYSQLSQRYVDESTAEYVAPYELQREIAAAEERIRDSWEKPDFSTNECDALLEPSDDDFPLTDEERIGVMWIRSVAEAHKTYVELSSSLYERMLEPLLKAVGGDPDALKRDELTTIRKAARGAARSVLPNATETKIFVTGNARSWRHFIEMRASRHADAEIRMLAVKVWRVLVEEAPALFGDYTPTRLTDGTEELTTPHRKV